MLAGLGAIGGAIALLVAGGLSENMVFFLTPSELQARGASVVDAPIRLGGQVKPGSHDWNADAHVLRFVITDGAAEVDVQNEGAPPQMFADGIGVILEGRYGEDGVFHSTNLMVKHSNEYKPPEEGDDPHEAVRSLIDDGTGG
jgi:cytochrome c-type biogenesis protein CcmE